MEARHLVAQSLFRDGGDVFGPWIEGRTDLGEIAATVVGAADTTAQARTTIDQRLNNVRCDPETIRHVGRHRTSQVVERPVGERALGTS